MENKGCVYFFKHVGLSPIKIGFSTNESPIGRFEQFKTYAPYGAELVGFIRTHNAKELETELHIKFSNSRLKGEWFDLTVEEVNKWTNFYSSLEDIEEENNFKVAWAKVLNRKTTLNDEFNIHKFFCNSNIIDNKMSHHDLFLLYAPYNDKNIDRKLFFKKLIKYCETNNYAYNRGNSNGSRNILIKIINTDKK